jgi:hypothetical protein
MLQELLYFILSVFLYTFLQIINIFAQIIVFGFLLYAFATLTRSLYAKTLGPRAELYITGWIGTPVHEMSHAIFCLIFKHKIDDMKLFTMKSTNGVIGYVTHSYDTRSWYQQAGNFFIGVAPILIGSIVIYLALLVFAPQIKLNLFNNVYTSNMDNIYYGNNIIELIAFNAKKFITIFSSSIFIIENMIISILNNSLFTKVSFWIFLYLSIAISSHMELSPADLSHAWRGIIVIFSFLLIVNTIVHFFTIFTKLNIPFVNINNMISILLDRYAVLLLFVSIMSFLNFLVSYLLLTPISLIKYKKFINPFKR